VAEGKGKRRRSLHEAFGQEAPGPAAEAEAAVESPKADGRADSDARKQNDSASRFGRHRTPRRKEQNGKSQQDPKYSKGCQHSKGCCNYGSGQGGDGVRQEWRDGTGT
jgi:hypothetical protein